MVPNFCWLRTKTMGKLGNALILSPFATHPLDAGSEKGRSKLRHF